MKRIIAWLSVICMICSVFFGTDSASVLVRASVADDSNVTVAAAHGKISLMAASNESVIYDFLRNSLGCNTAAACGILANIYSESSFNPTASVVDTNGLISYGICQWNGSRFEALKNYCSRNGYSYSSLTGQLNYLKYELNGTESNAWNHMKGIADNADGAYTAGYRWAQYFERCSYVYYTGRANLAKNTYWPKYNSSPTPTISGANAPGTLTVGATYSISGTISCGKSLTNVTVGCYDADGTMKTGKSVNPNSTSYNIRNIDASVYFNNLSPGVYRYRVSASTSSGTTTLVDKVFIVLAKSATVKNGTYILKTASNSSFSAGVREHSDDSGANVETVRSQDSLYQVFLVRHEGNGYYSLRNAGSGKYLDVNGAYSTSGTNVQQWNQNTSAAQRWQILPAGNHYCLVPQCGNTLCLDVNGGNAAEGTNIQVYTANLTAAQKYQLVRTDCGYSSGNKIIFYPEGGKLPGAFTTSMVSGVNTDRGAGELIVYNVSGSAPNTNQYGIEAAIDQNGKVTAIRKYGSRTQLTVPDGGMIVSGHSDNGAGGAQFVSKLKIGQYLACDYTKNTVSAYADEVSYLSENKYVRSGETYGKLPVPERTGYTFSGWYTAPSGGTQITDNSIYSVKNLYAKWTKKESGEPVRNPSPGSGDPGKSSGEKEPDRDESKSESQPEKGTVLNHMDTKAVYRVLKEGSAVSYAGIMDARAKTVKIPSTVTINNITYKVTSIAKDAFKNNKKIKTVVIGGNVTCIGKAAFQNCTSLEKVTISKNVEKIGSKAFYNCRKLRSLTVKTKKLAKKKIGSKAFSKAGSNYVRKLKVKVPSGKQKSYKKIFRQKGLSSRTKFHS